ncbi:MAG: periplasmic heavy metal sensor [Burkholderiales bacterium]|nr:periplasmic heavy metal sensor [Burkholderiales bacterium]
MTLRRVSCLVLLLAAAMLARGQAPAHHHEAPAAPYAGQQQREIKALSAQQVGDLRAGRGMSLALAAELNSYPGPSHVLALADALALSPAQRARTQALFSQMQHEARQRGEAVLAAERALDTLFSQQQATPPLLAAASTEAALAQGQLRESHLRYHLAMRALLTPEQVAAYNRLRGY